MTESSGHRSRDTDSFWHRRRPGIRYTYSVAAIVGGIVLLALFSAAPDAVWRLVGGVVLLVLGIASIPVYAWMDKRGL